MKDLLTLIVRNKIARGLHHCRLIYLNGDIRSTAKPACTG